MQSHLCISLYFTAVCPTRLQAPSRPDFHCLLLCLVNCGRELSFNLLSQRAAAILLRTDYSFRATSSARVITAPLHRTLSDIQRVAGERGKKGWKQIKRNISFTAAPALIMKTEIGMQICHALGNWIPEAIPLLITRPQRNVAYSTAVEACGGGPIIPLATCQN